MVFVTRLRTSSGARRLPVMAGGLQVRAADQDHGEAVDVGFKRDAPEAAFGGQVSRDHLRRLCEQRNPGTDRQG